MAAPTSNAKQLFELANGEPSTHGSSSLANSDVVRRHGRARLPEVVQAVRNLLIVVGVRTPVERSLRKFGSVS